MDTESRTVKIGVLVTEGDSITVRQVSWRSGDSLTALEPMVDSIVRGAGGVFVIRLSIWTDENWCERLRMPVTLMPR